MSSGIRIVSGLLVAGMSLATITVPGAEPTDTMRTFAKVFATLEARDHKGYCAAMHGAPYVDYLNRVCQSAVQNKVKKPEDCSSERTTQQLKVDTDQCLAMPAAEFEKTALSARERSKAFVDEIATQGVDGEKLLREERARLR